MPTDLCEPLSVDQWLLRCRECGATVEVSIADATEYAYTKWPRCCGQVMDLCAEVAQPVDVADSRRSGIGSLAVRYRTLK